MKQRDSIISRDIREHGSCILSSDLFRQAGSETHHMKSSVSDHSLNVCIASLQICGVLKKLGIAASEKKLIQASLCHDLGMLGRDQKYENRRAAWRAHPQESVLLARTIVSDLDDSVESMMRTHMWPASGERPSSREGVILTIADKYASAADWLSVLFRHSYKANIKQAVL